MNEDKRKALESAGWKFGSADEFLGERPMSDDKMRQEFEQWADYTNMVWRAWQAAYQAGRKAERAELERREQAALEKLRAELRAAKFGRTSPKQNNNPPPAT